MPSDALVIVVKNPEKGKVKTRLALSLGDEAALDIYLRLLARTRRVALSLDLERYLYYSTYIDRHDAWPPGSFHKRLQEGENIGERMHHAISKTLEHHEKVVLIGSDIVNLEPEVIREALDALSTQDYAIGPVEDGGYYLIGMKKPSPSLFSEITWSTATVFKQSVRRMRQLGGSYYILPTLADMDTVSDWEKYGHLL